LILLRFTFVGCSVGFGYRILLRFTTVPRFTGYVYRSGLFVTRVGWFYVPSVGLLASCVHSLVLLRLRCGCYVRSLRTFVRSVRLRFYYVHLLVYILRCFGSVVVLTFCCVARCCVVVPRVRLVCSFVALFTVYLRSFFVTFWFVWLLLTFGCVLRLLHVRFVALPIAVSRVRLFVWFVVRCVHVARCCRCRSPLLRCLRCSLRFHYVLLLFPRSRSWVVTVVQFPVWSGYSSLVRSRVVGWLVRSAFLVRSRCVRSFAFGCVCLVYVYAFTFVWFGFLLLRLFTFVAFGFAVPHYFSRFVYLFWFTFTFPLFTVWLVWFTVCSFSLVLTVGCIYVHTFTVTFGLRFGLLRSVWFTSFPFAGFTFVVPGYVYRSFAFVSRQRSCVCSFYVQLRSVTFILLPRLVCRGSFPTYVGLVHGCWVTVATFTDRFRSLWVTYIPLLLLRCCCCCLLFTSLFAVLRFAFDSLRCSFDLLRCSLRCYVCVGSPRCSVVCSFRYVARLFVRCSLVFTFSFTLVHTRLRCVLVRFVYGCSRSVRFPFLRLLFVRLRSVHVYVRLLRSVVWFSLRSVCSCVFVHGYGLRFVTFGYVVTDCVRSFGFGSTFWLIYVPRVVVAIWLVVSRSVLVLFTVGYRLLPLFTFVVRLRLFVAACVSLVVSRSRSRSVAFRSFVTFVFAFGSRSLVVRSFLRSVLGLLRFGYVRLLHLRSLFPVDYLSFVVCVVRYDVWFYVRFHVCCFDCWLYVSVRCVLVWLVATFCSWISRLVA
jgi:hypothetical protein